MPPEATHAEGVSARASAVVLVAASVGLLLFRSVMSRVGGLYPAELPASPYWVPNHAGLLYLMLPLAFAGTVIMFLAPGVLLVVGTKRRTGLADAVVKGFLVSFAIISMLGVAAARVFARPSLPFAGSLIILTAISWVWCVRRGGTFLDAAQARRRLTWVIGLSAVAAAGSVPIVFWQDLNPDGGEMLTMARSLDWFLIPRVPSGSLSGLGLGMVSEAYFARGFYLLGGLVESAPRLPFLLYVPVLFLALVNAVEVSSPNRIRPVGEAVLALGVCVVSVALAYNSSYHAYSADIASPAAIDVLAGICLLGMLAAFANGERAWGLAFAAVGYFARPIAVLFCGLLIVAHLVVDRRNWRTTVPVLVAAIGLCATLALAYERGLASWLGLGLVEPSSGIGSRRLRYLLFSDWRRFAYVVVPAGLLPAASLLLLPLQDRWARIWSCAALLFLASLSCLAFTALHQYLPVVLISIVVFWRIVVGHGHQARWQLAGLGAALVALMLSLPRSFTVDRSSRAIGAELDYRVGNYMDGPSDFRQAFVAKDLLESLFPRYDTRDPNRLFISAPLVFIHYSKTAGTPRLPANYLVLPPGEFADAPWTHIAHNDSGSVWVRDREAWQQELHNPPATDFRSRLLGRPRESLLPIWGVPARRYDIDTKVIWDKWVLRKDR